MRSFHPHDCWTEVEEVEVDPELSASLPEAPSAAPAPEAGAVVVQQCVQEHSCVVESIKGLASRKPNVNTRSSSNSETLDGESRSRRQSSSLELPASTRVVSPGNCNSSTSSSSCFSSFPSTSSARASSSSLSVSSSSSRTSCVTFFVNSATTRRPNKSPVDLSVIMEDSSKGDIEAEQHQPLNPTKSLPTSDLDHNLLLFTEEQDAKRPTTASFLSRIADLNSLPPTMDPDSANAQTAGKKGADLGTLTGVYLPCIQNIFGVILFIRMVWIVGTAGVPLAFLVVLICCMVTFTTSISLSAIATNGIVPAGGSYFMISRALGPEFGGAVGILFFLGTSVAGAMYITGAVEIILNYMAPDMALFGDYRIPAILYHNIRVYGTCFVAICGLLVFIGVKFVSKVAPIALICVILSILSIYGGVFINYEGTPDSFCSLGDRIMSVPVEHCTKNQSDPYSLYNQFCILKSNSSTSSSFESSSSSIEPRYECDQFFLDNEPLIRRAVPGIASGVLSENIAPRFRSKGDLIDYGDGSYDESKPKYANIFVDITTSFTIFVAIYFPSCTGILAGSNRSGDLKDGQKSIPIGTLAAQLTTSFVYLSSVVLFGAAFNNLFIRDKFGECMGGQLAVTLIAWPYPFLIVVGSLLSTLGAALQSLTSAPRLLQAIAQDNIIPFLNCFAHIDSRGEPVRALGITLVIAEIAVLIGNLDFIAPILTMFFLMCYMFVNLACTLQSLLRTPNWRPRFKFYHWSFSLMGVGLCLFVMFISAWHFALAAMFIAGCIYKYIEYRGAEKEWGDGFRGLALSAARFSLLRLEDGPPHTKNWRPQILVFVSLNEANLDANKDRKILTFASQLKAGKGLTLVASVLEGDLKTRHQEVQAAKNSLKKVMNTEKVKGFADVIISPSLSDGLCYFIQIAGLAGLKPNTVILGWPRGWKSGRNGPRKTKMFMDTIRTVTACRQHALLVPKGCETWPDSGDKMGGTIDIWWIVLDGGLLMLIPFLLRQHRTWKNTRLRIFTVAQLEDNSIQMKKDLAAWVYALRIDAEVEVVELQETDLSSYAYERTLRMEQRSEIMKHLERESTGLPGDVTPSAFGSGHALLYSAGGSGRSGRRESKTALAIEQLLRETKGIKEAREALEASEGGCPGKREGPTVKFSGSTKRKSSKGSESEAAASISESKDEDSAPVEEETQLQSKLPIATIDVQEPTPQPSPAREIKATPTAFAANLLSLKPDETNVRRMHTAVKLNEVIVAKSHASKLVVLNLPGLPKHMTQENENHYMEFVEALTEGLDRVLLIRGAGREVITIYS